jgi:hypothetical protein
LHAKNACTERSRSVYILPKDTNDIGFNNQLGFAYQYEAGGAKFAQCNFMIVENNYFHHNIGPGVWFDFAYVGNKIRNNIVEDNTDAGIFIEITGRTAAEVMAVSKTVDSDDQNKYALSNNDAQADNRTLIECNRVGGNGISQFHNAYAANIYISSSINVSVNYNTVRSDGVQPGILIIEVSEERNNETLLIWPQNNKVEYNNITNPYFWSGIMIAGDWGRFLEKNNETRFEANTYHVGEGGKSGNYWEWGLEALKWTDFQNKTYQDGGIMFETGGIVKTDIPDRSLFYCGACDCDLSPPCYDSDVCYPPVEASSINLFNKK